MKISKEKLKQIIKEEIQALQEKKATTGLPAHIPSGLSKGAEMGYGGVKSTLDGAGKPSKFQDLEGELVKGAPLEEAEGPDHSPVQVALINFANPGKAYGSDDQSTLYALQSFVDERLPEEHLEEWNDLMTGVWDEVRDLMGMVN